MRIYETSERDVERSNRHMFCTEDLWQNARKNIAYRIDISKQRTQKSLEIIAGCKIRFEEVQERLSEIWS